MSFEKYVLNAQDVIERELSTLASREADPVTFLNLEFALSEKRHKEDGVDFEKIEFAELLREKRDAYEQSLREKSVWALKERKALFSKNTKKYKYERDSLFNSYKNYSSLGQYYSYIDSMVAKHSTLDAKWGAFRKARARYEWAILKGSNDAWDAFIDLQKAGGNPENLWFLSSDYLEKIWQDEKSKRNYPVPFGWVFKFCREYNEKIIIYILNNCFPSIHDYEANKSAYPYFVDYMENHPFPESELFDLAIKKIVGYGTSDYAEQMIEYLDWVSENNLNNEAGIHYFMQAPQSSPYIYESEYSFGYPSESHFGLPKINPLYTLAAAEAAIASQRYVRTDTLWAEISSPFKVVAAARKYVRRPSSDHWWWPRPKPGLMFVPKVGFVDPKFFLPFYLRPKLTLHRYNVLQEERIRKAQERARRRRKKGGLFGGFIRNIWGAASTGDPFKIVGATVGNTMRLLNPNNHLNDFLKSNNFTKDIYRELNDVSGGFLDQVHDVSDIPAKWIAGEAVTEQDMMMALDLGIKVAVVVASGGTATAAIGVGAGQMQRGSWGDDEVGSIILQVAEIAAVAYVADAGVGDVVQELADRVIVDQARQQIYKRTDLGDTVFGTFMVEVGVRSGYRVSKGEDWVDTLMSTADEAAVKAAAKESPEAAMIMGAVMAVRKNGVDNMIQNADTLTSPEEWFDNFSWEGLGEDIKSTWKNLDSSTRKKLIGVTIMIAAGKLDPEDGLKMIGHQIALRQIDSFYTNEPVTKPNQSEIKRRTEALKIAHKAKAEEKLLQDLRQGKIPTPSQMTQIVDSSTAAWLWDSITNVIPSEAQIDAWKISFDIGLPDWSVDLPNMSIDLEAPDWAKVGSVDMPEWSKIKMKEEWRQKINEEFDRFKNKVSDRLTWQNVLYAYLQSLWPPNVPLRPVGAKDPRDFNYIDGAGNLVIRPALQHPYDHPMIQAGVIKRKYTEDEIAYNKARQAEIVHTVEEYERLTGESLDYETIYAGGLG